jgi:hypothetical protein
MIQFARFSNPGIVLTLTVFDALLPDPATPNPAFCRSFSRHRRISSQRLQHPLLLDALQAPLQKIDLQRLLANLAL